MEDREIDEKPSEAEIRDELRRILASPKLLNSPSQAAILEVIGNAYPDGLSDKLVGSKAFPGFIPGRSTDVRVNILHLRETLAEYYNEEGAYNAVILDVSKGRNYRLVLRYNLRAEAVISYRNALHAMSDIQNYPWDILDSLANCLKAIKAAPLFAPAYSLYAEFMLCYAANFGLSISNFGHGPYKGKRRGREEIGLAREYAIRAVRLDRNHWRGHAALGIYRACCGSWERARQSFAKAIELSPAQIKRDPWFLIFLVAIGKYEEAEEAADRNYWTALSTSCWKIILPVLECLYGSERLPITQRALTTYLGCAAWGCIKLANGNAQSAANAFQLLFDNHRIENRNPIASMGLWALFSGKAGDTDQAESILKYLLASTSNDWSKCEFAGVKNAKLIRSTDSFFTWLGNRHSAWEAERLAEPCPWETALVYLGLGQYADSIYALKRAQSDNHPMMMWLHVWPFFEPLYQEPEFRQLVQEMKLPADVDFLFDLSDETSGN